MQNRAGALFFSLCLLGFMALSSVDSLMTERALVSREVTAGYYGPGAYIVTRLVRKHGVCVGGGGGARA